MMDFADANLVIARIHEADALHARALAHLQGRNRFLVTFAVALELLLVFHRRSPGCVVSLAAVEEHFDVERIDLLYAAAEILDTKEVPTVFDAIHVAEAAMRGGRLHTADARLLRRIYPTEPL